MKISIVCGSQRVNSQSLKVAKYIEEHLKQKSETYLLDLPTLDLPLVNSKQSRESSQWRETWLDISQNLKDSDGFIFISPEWNGMATPNIKNFFLNCTNHELAHKPAMIVTTSSGYGGAFVVSELRLSSYKNTIVNYIPEHLIIRHVESVLNDTIYDEALISKEDNYIKKRINFACNLLINYSESLKLVRKDGLPLFELSPYGMS